MHRLVLPVLVSLGVMSAGLRDLAAQSWNDPAALALAERATVRRGQAALDSTLIDYRSRAHGFVFFLGQFGEGGSPPRLVKADQLELEVYWKAPRSSKQRIVGWRDQAELPTDIAYHIDHLGIVQNNFGAVIRIGDGDEVRDVPHPLSPGAPARYDYATGDTTTIRTGEREIRVATLLVRPKPPADLAAVAGTMYLDLESADLVRMALSFTRASYVDKELEDVSIVLENSLWEGRYWLPRRQEIEIRRRVTWLDMPLRGIIRGRWEVDSYEFNTGLEDRWFTGPEITAASRAERDQYAWSEPLAVALQGVAEPVRRNDLAAVRAEVARVAGRRVASGLQPRRLGARRVSDIIHANRVEGLALGAGFVLRLGGAVEARALGSYGTADGQPKGVLAVRNASGAWQVEVSAYREVRDIADAPVAAPLVNSFASQEFGDDYGDYYRATGAQLAVGKSIGRGGRAEWRLALSREAVRSLAVHGSPVNGAYRPNPSLGDNTFSLAALSLRRRSGGFAVQRDWNAELRAEVGVPDDGDGYGRVTASAQALLPLGATRLLVRAEGGAGTWDLPAHRTFVMGGRGTLLGDDFRRFGGRRAGLVHCEWRVSVRGAGLGVGSFARIPTSVTIAPFVAAGWTDAPVPGTPWVVTGDPRVTAGMAFEWLGLIRLEVGYGTQTKEARVSFDLARDFWPIL
jgi:hypothetical protein